MNRQRKDKKAEFLAEEAAILAEIGRIISSTLPIEEVYERFAREVKKLIPFDRVAVNLIDAERGNIPVPYESGFSVPGAGSGVFTP